MGATRQTPRRDRMINGVIAQKLQSLDQVLAELHSLGRVDAVRLRDD
jgi:hypothetical protein